ncbi:MAG: asparaginase [Streptosporangiales bacterium]|nr:asparaginase [Streptosporangiales bacterium]
MTSRTRLPRISVFSLGGTIASTNTPGAAGGGVTPQLDAAALAAAVPQLRDVAELETVPFRQTASGDLTFEDIALLAAEIRTRFDASTTGVVVTQGTDSIEETSFALDLLVNGPQPVVVTGAMRNPTLAGADGPANLLAAVQVAGSPQAKGLGGLVVFNDEIHAARFVRKTHTTNPSTFHSMATGALGWVVEGRPRIVLRPTPLPPLPPPNVEKFPRVALLTISLGEDARIVDQLESLGYAGLVVEAFGGGHVPARMVASLTQLASTMPVVLASRTGAGEVLSETYAFPGSERDLLDRGLIRAGFLDGPKSRVALTLLLAEGADSGAVRAYFRDLARG